MISIQLQSNFIEITLQHGCSPMDLLHIFITLFLRTPLDGCFCKEILTSKVSSDTYLSLSSRSAGSNEGLSKAAGD